MPFDLGAFTDDFLNKRKKKFSEGLDQPIDFNQEIGNRMFGKTIGKLDSSADTIGKIFKIAKLFGGGA